MTQVIATKLARKNHRSAIDRVVSLPPIQLGDGVLHLADAGERDVPHRAGDRVIRLVAADEFGLQQTGPSHFQLSYDSNAPDVTRAAVMAAGAASGSPICGDPASLALLTLAERVAKSDIPVLIEGPTGAGKEVLARYLHNSSARSNGPFVAVNCAAMPEAMLEALLFGHRKGAFTGASETQLGFFRAADGGTLLLDEIGEMPVSLQAKLLRALQEGEVTPLGTTKAIPVDVRIVACTNRDLPEEVRAGRFREDLYYRLNVFPLRVQALRERPGDIASLAYGLLIKHGGAQASPAWITSDAIKLMEDHNWPGNVRELENVIRRAMLLAGEGSIITVDHICFHHKVRVVNEQATVPSLDQKTNELTQLSDISFQSESKAILRALGECDGHRLKTARRLGISERTLRYRLASMREAGLAIAGARS